MLCARATTVREVQEIESWEYSRSCTFLIRFRSSSGWIPLQVLLKLGLTPSMGDLGEPPKYAAAALFTLALHQTQVSFRLSFGSILKTNLPPYVQRRTAQCPSACRRQCRQGCGSVVLRGLLACKFLTIVCSGRCQQGASAFQGAIGKLQDQR